MVVASFETERFHYAQQEQFRKMMIMN